MIQFFRTIFLAVALLLVSTTIAEADSLQWKQMKVDASAYNSVAWQTTADKLKPGMRGDCRLSRPD